MKIVITDGYTLNPGDLSWEQFKTIGEVIYYDRTIPDQVPERCKDANIIICNKSLITRDVINAAVNLQIIAITATGVDCVDINAAKEKGIFVCNVPEYGTHSVAQHTIALILELTNHVGLHAESVRQGEWTTAKDWSYSKKPVIELFQKKLGIVGYGRIGKQTAKVAEALGMEVNYYNYHRATGDFSGIPLEDLFSVSDFIVLHCPLTATNRQMVNKNLLALMKPTAYLINVSRGLLINEDDLYQALVTKTIAGAALDVLSSEPPVNSSNLFTLPNCIITPHNAWLSIEARARIMNTTFKNISAILKGTPVNIVV